ncbi:MAG TPA: BlaI/MecI/CopY family transcriptional regulator [Polyangia bacterium]
MAKKDRPPLSRREREIMDVVYRLGAPSAAEIASGLADPPSYSAVRALLSILVTKGHLRHESDGARYLYRPTVPRETAQRRALRDLVATFFAGSSKQAVVALLDETSGKLSEQDLAEIRGRIEGEKKQGR